MLRGPSINSCSFSLHDEFFGYPFEEGRDFVAQHRQPGDRRYCDQEDDQSVLDESLALLTAQYIAETSTDQTTVQVYQIGKYVFHPLAFSW
jgi:hypothetical protein